MSIRKGKVHFQQDFGDDSPLFSLAFHPEQKIYATGFATGRVTVQSYDDEGKIETKWTTQRHKNGSCRALMFDQTGEHLFSTGLDRQVKRADTETGKVVGKDKSSLASDPNVMVVNESYLVIGDENSNLSIFDQRTMKRVIYVPDLHIQEDEGRKERMPISSIVGLDFKNKYHFLTTGGPTVSHVDIRKPDKKYLSVDQGDEIASGCLASDNLSAFGMMEGIVSILDNSYLKDDMDCITRIRLSPDSIDCLIAGEQENEVYAGGGDGIVRKFNAKASRVEKVEYKHGKDAEISMLDFDCEYRLVSADLERLKVWKKDDEIEEDEDSDEDEPKKRKKQKKNKKPQTGSYNKGNHGVAQFSDL